MFPTIFALGIERLGPMTSKASSLLIMAIVGGALIPYLQGVLADHIGLQHAFFLPLLCYALHPVLRRPRLQGKYAWMSDGRRSHRYAMTRRHLILTAERITPETRIMTTRPILCFGEALIDFHAEGDDGPALRSISCRLLAARRPTWRWPWRDSAARPLRRHAVARPFGDFLLDSLQRAGVGTDDIARTDEATPRLRSSRWMRMANAASVSTGHPSPTCCSGRRTFARYVPRCRGVPRLLQQHDRPDAGRDHARRHATRARRRRAGQLRRQPAPGAVAAEVIHRPLLWPAMHLADVVKLCAEEFAWLAVDGEQAALDRLWLGRTRLLVVTDGATAALVPSRCRRRVALLSGRCVDTTAAGDAFVGGLLCRLAELAARPDRIDRLVTELPRLHAILRFAAACGALTVTRQGSFAAMPTEDEVLAFMETQA
jgi:fructokinase